MFNIKIDDNTLFAIIIVVALFIVIMYYLRRKYDSIDLYNILILLLDEYRTYKENQKRYKKNLEDFDGISGDETEFAEKIISTAVNKIRGSG